MERIVLRDVETARKQKVPVHCLFDSANSFADESLFLRQSKQFFPCLLCRKRRILARQSGYRLDSVVPFLQHAYQ